MDMNKGLISVGLAALLVLYGICECTSVWGQNGYAGTKLLGSIINEALSQGDCSRAQRVYNAWKELTEMKDVSAELQIKACRQTPAGSGVSVTTPLPKKEKLSVHSLASRLIKRIEPVYPEIAKNMLLSGDVVLNVEVDEGGNVVNCEVIRGAGLFRQPAMDAVRKWKYLTTLLGGNPVAVESEVIVKFNLPAPTTKITDEILRDKKQGIQFGNYKWRVLDMQGDKVLMITEDAIEQRQYNVQNTAVTWETCSLRKYLNGEFLQKFTEEERMKIAETQISNPDNLWYGTKGDRNTVDKIFLLSLEEVDRYFGDSGNYRNRNGMVATDDELYLSNVHDDGRHARHAKFGNELLSCAWWLRSPGFSSTHAPYAHGPVNVYGSNVSNISVGVRPAFWFKLKH